LEQELETGLCISGDNPIALARRWPSCYTSFIQRFNSRSAAQRLDFSMIGEECSPLSPQHVDCLLTKPLVEPRGRVWTSTDDRGWKASHFREYTWKGAAIISFFCITQRQQIEPVSFF